MAHYVLKARGTLPYNVDAGGDFAALLTVLKRRRDNYCYLRDRLIQLTALDCYFIALLDCSGQY